MSVRCVLVCVMIGLSLAGCGAARDDERGVTTFQDESVQRSEITLAEARSFDEFPLFFAGERVLGHPLVAILRRDDTARYVSFVYGDCEPARREVGCAPPIEIQVWPSASRNLGSYDAAAHGSPTVEPATVRGLPAAHIAEGQLELYASGSTVVVFSASRELALAVAARLRCLREGAPAIPVGALAC